MRHRAPTLKLTADSFVTSPTKIGNGYESYSILLYGRRRGPFPFHCMVGPDWPMLILVYVLILAANLTILPIISHLGSPVTIIGIVGFISLLYCYSAASCSDPGVIYDDSIRGLIISSDPPSPTDIIGGRSSPTELTREVEEEKNYTLSDLENQSFSHKRTQEAEEEIDDDGGSSGTHTVLIETPKNDSQKSPNLKPRLKPAHPPSTIHTHDKTQHIVSATTIVTPSTMECGKCEIPRPMTSRHCHYCGVCIDKLDHHWYETLYTLYILYIHYIFYIYTIYSIYTLYILYIYIPFLYSSYIP